MCTRLYGCVPCCVHVSVRTLRPYHVMQRPQIELCQSGGLGEEGLQTSVYPLVDHPRVYESARALALGSEKQMIDGRSWRQS